MVLMSGVTDLGVVDNSAGSKNIEGQETVRGTVRTTTSAAGMPLFNNA